MVFCDVGQGDAILVVYKNWEMLVDSGPNDKKVLSCLDSSIPFWDKKIEVFLLTHGDSDHNREALNVFKYYKVYKFFSNGELLMEIEQKHSSIKLNTFDVIKTSLTIFEVVNSAENYKNDSGDNEKSIAGILNYKDMEMEEKIKFSCQST